MMAGPKPPALTFSSAPAFAASRPPGEPPPGEVRAKAFRALRRRNARLKAAADVLPRLPDEGESLHALLTGFVDLALVLVALVRSRPAPCLHLRSATLTFSRRNAEELARLLEDGACRRVTVLASDFMAKSNVSLFEGARAMLAARGGLVASARSHAKVTTLEFADGVKLSLEGSANLRTSRNLEQITLARDAGLHDWHAAWIDEYSAHGQIDTSRDRPTG